MGLRSGMLERHVHWEDARHDSVPLFKARQGPGHAPIRNAKSEGVFSVSEHDEDRTVERLRPENTRGVGSIPDSCLRPGTEQNRQSTPCGTTPSNASEALERWCAEELLPQLQTQPKTFSKNLSDSICKVRHETAAAVAALAHCGYSEQLLEHGVLPPLITLLSSSRSCCRKLAVRTLQALLGCPVMNSSDTNSTTCDGSKRQSLKLLLFPQQHSKSNWMMDTHLTAKAVKQLIVIVRKPDTDDNGRRDAVDLLRLYAAKTSCTSSFKKNLVADTLLSVLSTSHSDSLQQSLVEFLKDLPEELLIANVGSLYDAVPALAGLLSTASCAVALATGTILRTALQQGQRFCEAFVDAQGVASLAPLLSSCSTSKLALELMRLVACHPSACRGFLKNSSLAALLDVAQSADEQSAVLALEVLTTVARSNREGGLQLIRCRAICTLKDLMKKCDGEAVQGAACVLRVLAEIRGDVMLLDFVSKAEQGIAGP